MHSADNFEIDDTLLVSCSVVSVPVGCGRVALTHEGVFKRSICNIRKDDNLYLPRSLVVAYAHTIRGQIRSGALQQEWEKIRNSRQKYQTECAQNLVRNASVIIPEAGCGLDEIHVFQTFFARIGIAIIIYSFQRFGRGDKPLYDGSKFVLDTNNIIKHTLRIMYYQHHIIITRY